MEKDYCGWDVERDDNGRNMVSKGWHISRKTTREIGEGLQPARMNSTVCRCGGTFASVKRS